MKAQLWKIKICSGPLEMVHGFSQKILEVYIPSFNISLNIAEDKINCFSTYEGRYSGNKGSTLVKTFDFPDYIVDALLLHISSTEKFTEKFTDPIKKVFSNFKDAKSKSELQIPKSKLYTNAPKTIVYVEMPEKSKKRKKS